MKLFVSNYNVTPVNTIDDSETSVLSYQEKSRGRPVCSCGNRSKEVDPQEDSIADSVRRSAVGCNPRSGSNRRENLCR